MGLNLFYTDGCPASYEPHGFRGCTDDDLHFAGGRDLATKTKKTSSLVAGAHHVGVVVTHVNRTDLGGLNVIPEDIDYFWKRSRLGQYKVVTQGTTIPTATSSSQPSAVQSQPSAAADILASPAGPSTQTREDMETRGALQQMLPSSSNPTGLIPTQTIVAADEDDDDEESDFSYQIYDNAFRLYHEAKPGRVLVRSKMAELVLHARVIQGRSSLEIFDPSELKRGVIKRAQEQSTKTIKCECWDNREQGREVGAAYGSHPQDSANNRSVSVRSVVPGSTCLATVGTTLEEAIVRMSISATAVCSCHKKRM